MYLPLTIHYNMKHHTYILLFFTFIVQYPAQKTLIPDGPLRYLPSGHGFDSAMLFNPWTSAMKNYLESSFPDQKFLDEIHEVHYKRSQPTKVETPPGEDMNDMSLLRFGKRDLYD